MLAEAADDKAFGMFSPGLQRRITDTKKAIADLTVQVGKQKDKEKELANEVRKLAAEEQRLQRIRAIGAAVAVAAYLKVASSLRNLRNEGMNNTVEAYRQNTAYMMLGREIAAVFLPATEASTNAMMASAKAMSGLNERGQNFTFVLSAAVVGLVSFKTAQLAAAAAGVRLTGVLGSLMKTMPFLGLAGGVLTGLAAIFLSSNEGAKVLENTMENLVKLANALGEALEEAFNNPGKFWDDFKIGLAVIGEKIGAAPAGRARLEFDEAVQESKKRNGLDQRRARAAPGGGDRRNVTPGEFRFEGVSDAFERVQIAAAKSSVLGKDVQQQQLDVEKQQLEVLKAINNKGAMPLGRAGVIAGFDF